jgi:hypothetical protein
MMRLVSTNLAYLVSECSHAVTMVDSVASSFVRAHKVPEAKNGYETKGPRGCIWLLKGIASPHPPPYTHSHITLVGPC